MSPRASHGAVLALLLLSSAALSQPRQLPQVAGPAPGAPVGGGAALLPTASGLGSAPAPTHDTTSAFAQWWGEIRGHLPERIRTACTASQAIPELAAWCQRYHGPTATEFDLEGLLGSDALVLAAYFSERRQLLQALDELDSALEALRRSKAASREQQEAASTTSEMLDAARGQVSLNSGVETATSLPGLLPGLELNAFLDRVFTGLAGALQERAEAEAVLYLLVEFDERICQQEVKDQWGQRKGHIRDWLPATCTAAHNNAFAATLGAGGTASLALLRKTVEQDLRAIPSHLVFEVVSQAQGGKYARAALPVWEMVDSMVNGVHPVRALDTLSRRLEMLPLEVPGTAEELSKLYTRLACVSGMPASFTRYTALVDDANQGLVPQMDANARGLAVLLLSLQKESCGWVYEPAGKQSRLKIWAALAPPLSDLAEGVFTVSADLRRLLEQARRLPEGAQDGGPERLAEATRLLAQQGVSALDAAHVAMDGVLRLNALMGAWLASSGTGAPERVAENQKVLLEARSYLGSSRDVLRMVVAAIARDLSTVYQLLLEHQAISSKTERYGGDAANRCLQAEAWKAPSAADPEARTSEWRCERSPCICLPEGFARYGGLLVALADAKDAQEVKAVVLASATPVGSWRWRSDADVHQFVSLSGLVGFGGSYSFAGPREDRGVTPRLLVPFGLDYQIGKAGLSWSAFFQVIDLAGYTQFVGVEERKAPRVMEAVSPGLWLKGMIPKTPVSLSLGAAYDLDAGGVTPAPAWRFSAGLSIDTPLILLSRN